MAFPLQLKTTFPRLLSRTFLLRPIQHTIPSVKHFSTSPATMTIKTYFDVSWQGPVLDASSKPTKEVKGDTTALSPPPLPHPPLYHSSQTHQLSSFNGPVLTIGQNRAAASTSISMMMLSPRLPRISVLFAPAKRDLDILVPSSIA